MLVAMGGMFSERSGVINIALEGIMAIGGLAGVFVLVLFPDLPAPALVASLSILASAVSGMIYSLLLGFSAITLKADQTIGGTALNMLATAIAIVLVKHSTTLGCRKRCSFAKLNYTNAAFIYKIGPFTVNIFLFIGIILRSAATCFSSKRNGDCACVPAVSIHRQPTLLVSTYTSGDTPVLSSPVHSAVSAICLHRSVRYHLELRSRPAGAGSLLRCYDLRSVKPFHIAGAAVFFAVFRSLANIADSTVLSHLGLSRTFTT